MQHPSPVLLTLALVVSGDRVLLGYKKRGFGSERWNGFGGKVEPGEAITAAAIRELSEEAGITATALEERGVLNFTFEGSQKPLEVHVFWVESFTGEPCESDEMRPEWFDKEAIPFDRMWQDDRHWFPIFLRGETFTGSFHFSADERLLHFELQT